MPTSQYGANQVRAKTSEVKDYHYDDARPGKPLYLLIPGGLIALASLLLIVAVVWRTWFDESLDTSTGIVLVVLLAPFYIGGVFLFSYGYELYDIPRAIRLTAIIVFITLAAVVIVAVLFAVLGDLGGGSSRSSKKSSASRGSSSGGGSSNRGGFFNWIPIFINGPGRTQTITREVVREVPVETKPQSIACPYCGRQYIAEENKYACPSCGAATPENLKPS